MPKDAVGLPAYGNQRTGWDAGCRNDYENPSTVSRGPGGERGPGGARSRR